LLDAAKSTSVVRSRLAGGASAKKLSISEHKVGWLAFTARRQSACASLIVVAMAAFCNGVDRDQRTFETGFGGEPLSINTG
jgi:hypothetical protein